MKADITIKLQLYIKLSNEKYFIDNALLLCENSKYKIIANINYKDAYKFSFRSKYWNDNMLTLKLNKEFSVKKAYLANTEIKVKFNNSQLTRFHSEHYLHKNYTTFIWEIDSFIYEVIDDSPIAENETVYYLTKNASELLKYERIDTSFQYKGIHFFLCAKQDENICLKSFIREDSIINEILLLMSFYLRTPIEYKTIQQFNTNTKKVEYHKTKYNILEKHIVNFQFMYLEIEKSDSFINFITAIKRNTIEEPRFSFIGKGIEMYVRSNYLDNLSKYILLYSVLATFANKIHNFEGNNEYKRIKYLFNEFDVNISLLDNEISSQNWHDSYGQKITNFAELRNEIMHSLPSQEILEFIDHKSDIISRLEFMTCIIILKELGFYNIQFVKDFNTLNVFNTERENNI